MAKSNRVLTVEITNESITIVEVTPSTKKQTVVHNTLIFETPEDSYEDGTLRNPDKIAMAIREQLNANGITNKNVIFVLSSSKVVNREVLIPNVSENKVKGIVNANASDYFPINIEDYVVSHSILEHVVGSDKSKQMKIMVVAAPITMVKAYYDLGSMIGLNVQSIDYVGNSMFQLIKTQTGTAMTTMVIQLGSESTILNIVKGDSLLLQRTVPHGTNAVVTEVMDARGVDATTAMTMLQSERMITVDFDDDPITGSFRYLINNIGRVIDFYVSKNPDKPIDDVFLTGDGALIRGIEGLFKIQLNIQTRIMDSLYNVKFEPKIDLKIYNPVYLIAPIGAAFAPMGLKPVEVKAKKAGNGDTVKYCAVATVAMVAIAVLGSGITIVMKKNAEQKRDQLNAEIAAIQDIENIINEYDAAKAKYEDINLMFDQTRSLNENINMFIDELEARTPKKVILNSYSSSDSGITISASCTEYPEVAKYVIELKKIACVDNAFVTDIAKSTNDAGEEAYTFNVRCNFVSMVEEEQIGVEEDEEATLDQEAAQ